MTSRDHSMLPGVYVWGWGWGGWVRVCGCVYVCVGGWVGGCGSTHLSTLGTPAPHELVLKFCRLCGCLFV